MLGLSATSAKAVSAELRRIASDSGRLNGQGALGMEALKQQWKAQVDDGSHSSLGDECGLCVGFCGHPDGGLYRMAEQCDRREDQG